MLWPCGEVIVLATSFLRGGKMRDPGKEVGYIVMRPFFSGRTLNNLNSHLSLGIITRLKIRVYTEKIQVTRGHGTVHWYTTWNGLCITNIAWIVAMSEVFRYFSPLVLLKALFSNDIKTRVTIHNPWTHFDINIMENLFSLSKFHVLNFRTITTTITTIKRVSEKVL